MKLMRTLAAVLISGCHSGGDPLVGFVQHPSGDGPVVAWDLFAEPLPDIPFPNDFATRPDSNAATGRRVNVSLVADTELERDLRTRIADLDGFGTFQPLWVRFSSPDPEQSQLARIELEHVARVQAADTHFEDDVVLVIDVTRDSPTYGEPVVLDFGNGNFPVGVEDPAVFFANDPRDCASNLVFETYNEDLDADGRLDRWEDTNQNGLLDPGEDRDGDGHLDPEEDTDSDGTFDQPNLWGTVRGTLGAYDPCAEGDRRDYTDLITFYELESDTLWFRPVVPLAEQTTYAVVLTRDLRGENGDPVQSPFSFVHHLQQTEALRPLFEDGLLHRLGRTTADVAFAWTFTTQSVTRDLVRLRRGLDGDGPFAALASAYPPVVTDVVPVTEEPGVDAHLLRPDMVASALRVLLEEIDLGYTAEQVQPLLDSYGAVDYIVAGDFVTPDFLAAGGGVFDLSPAPGEHVPSTLRFLLVVPKAEHGDAPFPVALYCHGYASVKLEALAFAGGLAKLGIATFAIDAYSHGLSLGGEFDALIEQVLADLGGEALLPAWQAVRVDRDRDLNGDGLTDPGGDFWTVDLFHTRDIVRQTVIDYLQAIRVLSAFDGRTWGHDLDDDGSADLAGDFNVDGVVDTGGPTVPYYVLGTSMGGIHSAVLGAVDPAIIAATPISPGGGLLEVGLRTDQAKVRRGVLLPMLGPMVVSRPSQADARITVLEWLVNDIFFERRVGFASLGHFENGNLVGELQAGDRVEVENLASGRRGVAVVGSGREVRVPIRADRYDPVVVRVRRPDGTLVAEIDTFERDVDSFQTDSYRAGDPLVAIQEGFGYRRNTPDLRRLIGLAQMILEPADPVNYGARYANPLAGATATNALFVLTVGDMTVPISSGIALARAAGAIDHLEIDPVYGTTHNDLLINHHVVEAIDELSYFESDPCHHHPGQVNFDIDDLSNGRHPSQLPRLAAIRSPAECDSATPPAWCDAECITLPPLRATLSNASGVRAVRFPALRPTGQHAIGLPNPTLAFDPSMFTVNQIALFLKSGGTRISDHPCLANNDCRECAGEPDCPDLPPPTTMAIP
jgi:hypothetical protein